MVRIVNDLRSFAVLQRRLLHPESASLRDCIATANKSSGEAAVQTGQTVMVGSGIADDATPNINHGGATSAELLRLMTPASMVSSLTRRKIVETKMEHAIANTHSLCVSHLGFDVC